LLLKPSYIFNMIKFDILTIFPEMFSCYFQASMMEKAQAKGLVRINVRNLRDYASDKHKVTDDIAYGGISGMVMKVEPIYHAVSKIKDQNPKEKVRVILTSPRGSVFNQKTARRLAEYDRLIFIAGHYKGVDQRVADYIADEEISLGEFVITGGELPVMVMVDAISRMVPGVIGNKKSKEGESFSENVVFEHPVYTRPASFEPEPGKVWQVPEVLVSGNHKEIEKWRQANRFYRENLT